MRAIRSVSVGVFLFVALLAGVASAQQATIVGTVTDESKAVLPGVTVTVSDMAKGTQIVAVTDARGEYRVPQLTPGDYKVQAELAGSQASCRRRSCCWSDRTSASRSR